MQHIRSVHLHCHYFGRYSVFALPARWELLLVPPRPLGSVSLTLFSSLRHRTTSSSSYRQVPLFPAVPERYPHPPRDPGHRPFEILGPQ